MILVKSFVKFNDKDMKKNFRISSRNLAYSFGIVILFGAIISGLTATDDRWMGWHFSRLGEGGTFSSLIFNLSLLISAVIMFLLGMALSNEVRKVSRNGIDTHMVYSIISRAFTTVTVCLIGVAIFPFDRFPAIHNIFGYSMLFIFLWLCVVLPGILPIFSKTFYNYSRSIILYVIVCYALFLVTQTITLLVVETILFVCLYIWLLSLINGIQKSSS